MSELDNRVVQVAWSRLFEAIDMRDRHGLTPEVIRVARALCQCHGDVPDDLVQIGIQTTRFGLTGIPIHQGAHIMLAWRAYVGMASNAIQNLEIAREEANTPRESAAGRTVPGDMGGYAEEPLRLDSGRDRLESDRVTDAGDIVSADLAAMVDHLSTLFDVGPDGHSAVCRQTGQPFATVAFAAKGDDAMARKTVIRRAMGDIILLGGDLDTLYWRKRPEITLGTDGMVRIYCRVAFGP